MLQRTARRRIAVAALCCGGLACQDGAGPGKTSGPVRVQPDAAVYKPGDAVNLTITNLSGDLLQFSVCSYQLERLGTRGDWHVVFQAQNPCIATLQNLGPFGTRKASITLPHELAPGRHRVRFPAIGARQGDEEPLIPAAQEGDSFLVEP